MFSTLRALRPPVPALGRSPPSVGNDDRQQRTHHKVEHRRDRARAAVDHTAHGARLPREVERQVQSVHLRAPAAARCAPSRSWTEACVVRCMRASPSLHASSPYDAAAACRMICASCCTPYVARWSTCSNVSSATRRIAACETVAKTELRSSLKSEAHARITPSAHATSEANGQTTNAGPLRANARAAEAERGGGVHHRD